MNINKTIGVICLLTIVIFLSLGGRECGGKKLKAGSSATPVMIFTPLGLVATTVSKTQIDLQWEDNADNEDGYEVERNYAVITTIVGAVSGVMLYSDGVITPLTPTTAFTYRVRAYSGSLGFSAYSGEASATTYGSWSGVVAGGDHTFGTITTSATARTIWAWGLNTYGELGLGDFDSRNIPAQIGTQTDWATVVVGLNHAIALKANSTIWGWGSNGYGQLALSGLGTRSTPTLIGTTSDWTFVAVGARVLTDTGYSLARRNPGALYGTGFNGYGQLGVGGTISTTNRDVWTIITPTPTTIIDWATVACGNDHTIARRAGGTIYSWGYNEFGQLGLGYSSISSTDPSQIGTAADWAAVSAGGDFSIARKAAGSLWSWGRNNFGQLGLDNAGDAFSRTAPSQIGVDVDWAEVVAGSIHAIARKNNGTIYTWGSNFYGQLGTGLGADSDVPIQIGTDTDWATIAAGTSHSAATKTYPWLTMWLWGYNVNGQLGFGDTIDRNVPTKFIGK